MLYTFLHAKLKFLPKKLQVSKNLRTFAAPVPAKPLNDLKCAGRFIFYTFPFLRFSYFQTILISL